ncbi:MAG TPA: ester cyclase [Ktedonobacteraceae bacterium]|nr:ester cyclase [Ktedonobacteraceae bacterium]
MQDEEQPQAQEQTIPDMVDDVRAGKMNRRQLIKRLTIMGVSAAGAGAIAAVAAHQFSSNAAAPQNNGDNTNAQQQIDQHDQHIAHQSTGNIQQLHQDYHENAIVEDSMYPAPFVGRQAIMARKSAGMAAIPNVQINVTKRIVHGNTLTVEWTASGTHVHDYPGLPATGRTFSIPGVTVVVRQNGKIMRESLYYDMAEVRRQFGL